MCGRYIAKDQRALERELPFLDVKDMNGICCRTAGASSRISSSPYPDELLVAWPVNRRVTSPANNDDLLIRPAESA
jgi:hypothetical protein